MGRALQNWLRLNPESRKHTKVLSAAVAESLRVQGLGLRAKGLGFRVSGRVWATARSWYDLGSLKEHGFEPNLNPKS